MSGVRFGLDTIASQLNDVSSVEVQFEEQVVTPRLVVQAPTSKVTETGYVGLDGTQLMQIYLRFDELVPNGPVAAPLRLLIRSDATSDLQIIVVDAVDLGNLWLEILPWRATRTAPAPRSGSRWPTTTRSQ